METTRTNKTIRMKFENPFSKRSLKQIKKYKSIYIMMIPVLLYFIVFSYYPLGLGFVQSFQKNKLIGAPVFAGFDNYKEVISDYQFGQSFINSLIMGVGTLALSFVLSLLAAIGFNELKNKFSKALVQTASYLPNLFSWTVVGGMWVFVLSTNGLVNSIAGIFGHPSQQYMAESKLAYSIMILTAAWKSVGYNAVLFLASIVTIDPCLFEAAQIDGASRIRQIINIVIPHLVPTMKVLLVLGTMGLLRNFDQVFVMNNAAILDKVMTVLLYIYNEGILQFKVGKATAAATLVLIVTLVITFIVRWLIKYDENY